MKNYKNEIYSKGFNEGMRAVKEYGFIKTLECIVDTRRLPPKMEEDVDNESAKGSLSLEKNDLAT